MQDDSTVFRCNNEHARALFYDLLERAERGVYDDDFLAQLCRLSRGGGGRRARRHLCCALFACAKRSQHLPSSAESAPISRRPVQTSLVWKVLADAYEGVGRTLDTITMQGYIKGMYPETEIALTIPEHCRQEALNRFSVASNVYCSAPLISNRSFD